MKKFRILDSYGNNVFGDITENNVYLCAYANWYNGLNHSQLEVGQSTNVKFNLSGEVGYYRVLRIS